MKLLLDEMYPAAIAVSLRAAGHDVVAVQEDVALRRLSDETLFAVAQDMGRALVTENVEDYVPLDADAHSRGVVHHGLVFTTNRSFPRHRSAFIGRLAQALDEFLGRQRESTPSSLTHWLKCEGDSEEAPLTSRWRLAELSHKALCDKGFRLHLGANARTIVGC